MVLCPAIYHRAVMVTSTPWAPHECGVWSPHISVLIIHSLSACVWCVPSVDDEILVLGDDA